MGTIVFVTHCAILTNKMHTLGAMALAWDHILCHWVLVWQYQVVEQGSYQVCMQWQLLMLLMNWPCCMLFANQICNMSNKLFMVLSPTPK